MKLLLENWRQYQLLTEAQDIGALYESGQITEGEFLDKIKRFAKKKGIPLALALSLAGSTIGGLPAQAGVDDGPVQDPVAQTQSDADEEWTGPVLTTDRLKKIQDYPLSPAPKGVAPGFVYVPAENIPDSAYLGDDSGYENAGEYRQTVKTNSLDLLMKQLFGKDSGAIFGGGDSPYSAEFEKTEDGKNILPLEWSLSHEAAVEKYIASQK